MDAMHFLGFAGILMAGAVMAAAILELLNTERHAGKPERRVEVEPAVRSVAAIPAFFERPQAAVDRPPSHPEFDDALIAYLEAYVRAERAMVSRFVHVPSLDSLYRQAPFPTLH